MHRKKSWDIYLPISIAAGSAIGYPGNNTQSLFECSGWVTFQALEKAQRKKDESQGWEAVSKQVFVHPNVVEVNVEQRWWWHGV